MLERIDHLGRRAIDVIVSAAVLIPLARLLLLTALLIRVTSRGSIFFVQPRVERHKRLFHLLMFRTTAVGAPVRGPAITVRADPRVTPLGRWLPRFRLDELPQFLAVLAGSMRIIGPHPEVSRYIASYTPAQRAIFRVRPGITDAASLAFRDESSLLATYLDPERAYHEGILGRTLAIGLDDLERQTVLTNLAIAARTVCGFFCRPAHTSSVLGLAVPANGL